MTLSKPVVDKAPVTVKTFECAETKLIFALPSPVAERAPLSVILLLVLPLIPKLLEPASPLVVKLPLTVIVLSLLAPSIRKFLAVSPLDSRLAWSVNVLFKEPAFIWNIGKEEPEVVNVLLVIVKTFLSLFSRDNAAELFPVLIIVPTNVKTFSSLSVNCIDVPLLPGLPLSALLRLPVIEKVFLLLPLLKKISLEPFLITDILPSTVISLLVLASNCKPIVPDTLPLSLMLSSVMVL